MMNSTASMMLLRRAAVASKTAATRTAVTRMTTRRVLAVQQQPQGPLYRNFSASSGPYQYSQPKQVSATEDYHLSPSGTTATTTTNPAAAPAGASFTRRPTTESTRRLRMLQLMNSANNNKLN